MSNNDLTRIRLATDYDLSDAVALGERVFAKASGRASNNE